MKRYLILAFSIFVLAGCASLSKEECRQADWHMIGLEDGARGYPLTRISSHRKACADAGVTPDLARYRAGLEEGYRTYCTRANGYQVGIAGQEYQNVCEGPNAESFSQAYQHGRDSYRLRQTAANLDRQINDNHAAIAELAEDSSYHEEQLVHHHGSAAERQSHLDSIKYNSQEISKLEESITYAERERSIVQRDLTSLLEDHYALGFSP